MLIPIKQCNKISEINNKFLSGESVRAGGTELTGQLEQERIKEQDIITRKFLSGKFATPEAEARFLYGVEHGSVTEMPPIKGHIQKLLISIDDVK